MSRRGETPSSAVQYNCSHMCVGTCTTKKNSYLGLSLLLSIFDLTTEKGRGTEGGKKSGLAYDRQFPTSGGETYLFAKTVWQINKSFLSSGARNYELGESDDNLLSACEIV